MTEQIPTGQGLSVPLIRILDTSNEANWIWPEQIVAISPVVVVDGASPESRIYLTNGLHVQVPGTADEVLSEIFDVSILTTPDKVDSNGYPAELGYA